MTCLKLSGDRVFIHVDVILVNGIHDKLVALRFHPCCNERGQIQPRIPIQHEFIVDDLVCGFLGNRILWNLKPIKIFIESL